MAVRVARPEDAEAVCGLARAFGTGLTNLPADRDILADRFAAGLALLAAPQAGVQTPLSLVLEADGRIAGTGAVFPAIGVAWPFYSYKINRLSQTSRQVGRSVAYQILTLTNDLDGAAEVACLLVDPRLRGRGAGRLMARSRYLFIGAHRALFGERVIAEVRGWHDAAGASPVWEAIGRRFYDMSFEDADRISGTSGGQFIADLGPRHPIYTNLLPEAAQAALGQPHAHSAPAYRLLLEEGFRYDGYVDIFDGGPTVAAHIDELRGLREARRRRVADIRPLDEAAPEHLVCAGRGADFRAARGALRAEGQGALLSPALARALGVGAAEEICHVRF
jgi:arginine N-succinyltransferase